MGKLKPRKSALVQFDHGRGRASDWNTNLTSGPFPRGEGEKTKDWWREPRGSRGFSTGRDACATGIGSRRDRMIFAIVRARALRCTSPSARLRRASTSPRTRGGYWERDSAEWERGEIGGASREARAAFFTGRDARATGVRNKKSIGQLRLGLP
jgi:hypothetical protein